VLLIVPEVVPRQLGMPKTRLKRSSSAFSSAVSQRSASPCCGRSVPAGDASKNWISRKLAKSEPVTPATRIASPTNSLDPADADWPAAASADAGAADACCKKKSKRVGRPFPPAANAAPPPSSPPLTTAAGGGMCSARGRSPASSSLATAASSRVQAGSRLTMNSNMRSPAFNMRPPAATGADTTGLRSQRARCGPSSCFTQQLLLLRPPEPAAEPFGSRRLSHPSRRSSTS
jgi:hypothetical protein